MVIARDTVVHEACNSTQQAASLFRAHGVHASKDCQVVWDEATLDDAEMWCHIKNLDALIAELNLAITMGAPAGASPPADR